VLDAVKYKVFEGARKGAYVLEAFGKDIVLVATGSEVEVVMKAALELKDAGINATVVSMPSFKIFEEQTEEHKMSIFPHGVPKISVEAGATMSTHLGNAAHATLHKTQNYIWDQLAEERLTASFIVDGIHIPRVFAHAAMRAKGLERCVLVTDAVMPAMCQPGPYKLGEVEVEMRPDGVVVLRGGDRLAGSAVRMNQAIATTVNLASVSLHQAITMATTNAARVGRIAGRQRGLIPGEKADLVRFTWDSDHFSLNVVETIVAGISVYKA